jgi:PEP-CTERM motif-containing protein
MKRILTAVSLAALAPATPAAASTTIDFESTAPGLQPGPLIIGDATFSSPGNIYVQDFNFDGNLQACAAFEPQCNAELDVAFSSAISGLTFLAAGDNAASTLTVFLNLLGGGTDTVLFTLDGASGTYDTIDLSAYSNILSFTLNTDDPYGLSYDNFTYDAAGAVPEPATWAMMIFGFGAIGFGMRRRKQTKLTFRRRAA